MRSTEPHPDALDGLPLQVTKRLQASNPKSEPASEPEPAPEPEFEPLQVSVLDLQFRRLKKQWNKAKGRFEDKTDPDDTINWNDTLSDAHYAFSLVRMLTSLNDVSAEVHVRSQQFITAAKHVMAGKRNIAWETRPVKLDAYELLAFLPKFMDYLHRLRDGPFQEENVAIAHHLEYFATFLREEFREDLLSLTALRSEKFTIFPLLWDLLVPGMVLFTHCDVTGQPSLVRLNTLNLTDSWWDPPDAAYWTLVVEYIDLAGDRIGLVEREIVQPYFSGARPVRELVAYPMDPNVMPNYDRVMEQMIERGKKRASLTDWCHKQYDGTAFKRVTVKGKPDKFEYRPIPIKSRIIIDREMFDQNSTMAAPPIMHELDLDNLSLSLHSDFADAKHALMAPRVYGFSLSDKAWLYLDVTKITDIEWDVELYNDLDLDPEKKELLRALIEARSPGRDGAGAVFSDASWGKGMGLICNLHGAPGSGKTMTAEALSEVTQNPLYIVGPGDLGTYTVELERRLWTLFRLAARWHAVVLIYDADVYLEESFLNQISRNAAAVILMRKLEYHSGVVFLTTNRDSIFEGGMKSRIDLSLSYENPTEELRVHLWDTLLRRTNMAVEERAKFARIHAEAGSLLHLNGRQIKSAVKLATSNAEHEGRATVADDVLRVVAVLERQGKLESRIDPPAPLPPTTPLYKMITYASIGAAVGLLLDISSSLALELPLLA
ncbi:P-loop containing nucleoside triphosphate hydrolase protein [Dentipellis sp. KUC8613]|nr:P-loop containing nucleoside triphosphate hydrolase protein [Dentipellis sp. KUC8613]